MGSRIMLNAHVRYLVATNAAALILVVLLLFCVSRIPMLLSPLAVVVLSLIAAAVLGAQILLWLRRGIHAVEVNGDTLTLYRGRARISQRLERGEIARIQVVNRLGRRTVVVHPRSGKLIRVGEDAFPRADFMRLCAILGAWKKN